MDASVSRAYAQRWLRGKRPGDDQVRVWRLVSAPQGWFADTLSCPQNVRTLDRNNQTRHETQST